LETPIRILVVDDFEPFRRFVCSTLLKRPELQVVGEASDGLEAIQKAEELQPDLIVLDIGLPKLSGIEAARQIRGRAPRSKIIFLSQESSTEVVQEALGLGARGYVVKTHAGNALLKAVDAVLQGGQFVSKGLSGSNHSGTVDTPGNGLKSVEVLPTPVARKPEIARSHQAIFYPDDASLVVGFGDFIEASLDAGKSVIAVLTDSHLASLSNRLRGLGVDIAAALEQGRYFALDVADILPIFMRNDLADPMRFLGVVGDLVVTAARAKSGNPSQVAICGETASILWAQGKADAAIEVERLCNRLAKQYEMDILCGFSLGTFDREEDRQIFQKICSEA
jgi:DNA-binding NarL/FixJ family response regulator